MNKVHYGIKYVVFNVKLPKASGFGKFNESDSCVNFKR